MSHNKAGYEPQPHSYPYLLCTGTGEIATDDIDALSDRWLEAEIEKLGQISDAAPTDSA